MKQTYESLISGLQKRGKEINSTTFRSFAQSRKSEVNKWVGQWNSYVKKYGDDRTLTYRHLPDFIDKLRKFLIDYYSFFEQETLSKKLRVSKRSVEFASDQIEVLPEHEDYLKAVLGDTLISALQKHFIRLNRSTKEKFRHSVNKVRTWLDKPELEDYHYEYRVDKKQLLLYALRYSVDQKTKIIRLLQHAGVNIIKEIENRIRLLHGRGYYKRDLFISDEVFNEPWSKIEQELDNLDAQIEERIKFGVHYFDSPTLTADIYSEEVTDENENRLFEIIQKEKQSWDKVAGAFASGLLIYIEFTGLYLNIHSLQGELIIKYQDFFHSQLNFGLIELCNKLEESDSKLDGSKKEKSDYETELSGLITYIDELLEEKLDQAEADTYVENAIDIYKSDIQYYTNEQTEVITIVEEFEFKEKIEFELDGIKWRESLNRYIYEEHLRKVDELSELNISLIQYLKASCIELKEAISMNFKLAADASSDSELQKQMSESEEPDEFESADAESDTEVGIDRVLNQIAKIQKHLLNKNLSQIGGFQEESQQMLTYLSDLLHDGKIQSLKLRDVQLQVKSTALAWNVKLNAVLARGEDKSLLAYRFLLRKIKWFYDVIAPWLGLEIKEKKIVTGQMLGDYLLELQRIQKNLPAIYRKVFDFDRKKEVDITLFTSYERELTLIKDVYDSWQDGAQRAVVVVGESGSGKSAFIAKSITELGKIKKLPQIQFHVNETLKNKDEWYSFLSKTLGSKGFKNDHEVINYLCNQPRMVCRLEGMHNLYLRAINGFKPIESLFEIISNTTENVFWITSVSRYTWEYFVKVLKSDFYFTNIIETDKLNKESLKEIIIRRHRTTGYQLRFEPNHQLENSRAYKKVIDNEEKRQNFLEDYLFDQIYDISTGNITIAMIQWIRSITDVTKLEMEITIKEAYTTNLPAILQSEEYFTLAYFVLHGFSYISDYAKVIHDDEAIARQIFSRLMMLNLLSKNDNDIYELNTLVYRPVVRELKRRNILY